MAWRGALSCAPAFLKRTSFSPRCAAPAEVASTHTLFQHFLDDPLTFLTTQYHGAAPGQGDLRVQDWMRVIGVQTPLVQDLVAQFLAATDQRPPFIVVGATVPAINITVTDKQYAHAMRVLEVVQKGPVVEAPWVPSPDLRVSLGLPPQPRPAGEGPVPLGLASDALLSPLASTQYRRLWQRRVKCVCVCGGGDV